MEKRTLFLVRPDIRERAKRFIDEAPDGYTVAISPPTKKRIQEEAYHAKIGDIAEQSTYAGQRWDKEDMKRILVDEFADEMRNQGRPLRHDGRLIPSENGRRVIQLGIQTRNFLVSEASDFLTFLDAWAADRGVVWSKKTIDNSR